MYFLPSNVQYVLSYIIAKQYFLLLKHKQAVLVMMIWWLDLQLPVQSVPITSSNPVNGKVYSIQHYVIKFVSDLGPVSGFLWIPPPIKLTTTI